MSNRSTERRLDDLERALDARPLVLVIAGQPLSPEAQAAAFEAARAKAGLRPGAPALEYLVVTGVGP